MDHLAHLVSPLTPEVFIERYWQRQPLYLRGHAGKFASLFDRDAFLRAAPAARMEAFLPHAPTGMISTDQIGSVLAQGGMVCATGIDKGDPRLARYAEGVRRSLQETGFVDFRAYLSAAGKGLALHYDERTATTLQIQGRKRWWFSPKAGVDYPRNPHRSQRREEWERVEPPALKKMVEVILEPGDVLCLPAGTWHQAQALEESLSLNLAVEHRIDYFDLLAASLRLMLGSDPYWRSPPPAALDADDGGLPAALVRYYRARGRRIQRILGRLQPESVEWERTWRRAVAGIPLQARGGDQERKEARDTQRAAPSELRPGDVLVRRGPFAYTPRRGSGRLRRLFLYHGATELTLPGGALPILRRLQSVERFEAVEAVGWSGRPPYQWDDVRSLLEFLLEGGVLSRVEASVRPESPATHERPTAEGSAL